MKFGTLLLLSLAACFGFMSSVNSENATDIIKENLSPPNAAAPWNKYTIIATGTVVVFVAVGITAVISLFSPLVMYKLCYVLGECNYNLDRYVDKSIVSERYRRAEEFVRPTLEMLRRAIELHKSYGKVEKRSLKHVGPILQSLAAAYEEYTEQDGEKKNFEKDRSYTN